MSKKTIFLDSFGGSFDDLKRRERTRDNVLQILSNSPMVSCFDQSEHYQWLPGFIQSLVEDGLIEEVRLDYPWDKYPITEAGRKHLAQLSE